MSKEKTVKVELKLKRPHPRKSYRLGKHSIGIRYAEYELDENEVLELAGKGAQHWVMLKPEKKPAKPASKPAAKKE